MVKRLRLLLVLMLSGYAFAQCPATYNFPGSGPLNSTNWTQTSVGGTSVLKEGSGTTFPTTASTQGMAIWVGASCSPGNDHFSQAVLTGAGGLATGVMVRATAPGNGYLYAPGLTGIYVITALGGSAIASCPAVAVGHTMTLAAIGTTLTAYDNGSPICQAIDATYTTGNAGILVDRRSTTTDSLGSFQVGVSPPVPLLSPSAALSTAVFQNSDGGANTYPSIGANPTYQQATKLRFIPSNINSVYHSGATPQPICYRTDGVAPAATTPGTCDAGSTTYTFNAGPSGLINFDGSTTIKLLSTAVGFANSGVVTISLTIQPMYPYPVGGSNGTYSYSPLIATLNGAFGSNLIYTTNGTTPTASGTCTATNGTAAANGVQVTLPNSATTTVKFITCVGGASSSVQSGTYTQRAQVTWYVDTTANGGGTRFSSNMTSGQCNGQSTTPYVSGVNQPCPFNDIRYLWDDDSGLIGIGQWVIAGGDIVIVKGCTALATQSNPSNPNCRIGWDINSGGGINNNWCNSVGNQPCTNPWIPAGSATQHTQILGKNFAACATGGQTNPRNYASQLTQIFGGMGLTSIFNLDDTQHITLSCLEITAHNGVCSTAGQPNFPRSCSRNTPLDDYASNGLAENNQTADVTMFDIYIHGMTNGAGIGGPIGPGVISLTRGFIGFNGFAAWNMDDGRSTPNGVGSSLITSYVTMIGNGCNEEYPIVHAFSAQACWDTTTGGFGDAFSGQDTVLHVFQMDHDDLEYNTKDATLGPHPLVDSVIVTNSTAIGNMGSAWKLITNANGTLDFHDNLSVFNCNRMSAALPGAAQNFNLSTGLGGSYLSSAGGFCRAGGDGWASGMIAGSNWQIYNNTFVHNVDSGFQLSLGCGTAYLIAPCNTTVSLNLTNNVFIGYQMSGQPNGVAVFGSADSTLVPTWKNNISIGAKPGFDIPCAANGNQCTDPLLVSQPPQTPLPTTETFLDNFNFNLTSTSPAITAGTTPCPTTDFAGNTQTSPCTIGAMIFASGTPTVATPTASPVAGTYSSTQTVTLSTTTGGATICYTIDGSTPTATTPGTCSHGTTYSGTITVATTTTIMALGTLSGDTNSSVATFVYTITVPTVATPTASPAAGTYTSTQSITLSDVTSGAAICFTNDGSTPTAPTAGTCSGGTTQTYSAAITVASTTTIKAVGTKAANTNSGVFSGLYTIVPPVTPVVSFSGTVKLSGSVTIP